MGSHIETRLEATIIDPSSRPPDPRLCLPRGGGSGSRCWPSAFLWFWFGTFLPSIAQWLLHRRQRPHFHRFGFARQICARFAKRTATYVSIMDTNRSNQFDEAKPSDFIYDIYCLMLLKALIRSEVSLSGLDYPTAPARA